MNDYYLVERYLEMAYRLKSNGSYLCVFDKTAKKFIRDEFLINEVKLFFGDSSVKIATTWLRIKKEEIDNAIVNELLKFDLDRGSYVIGHELAMKMKMKTFGVTKDYTDTLFHPFYLRNKLNYQHKELFKEFRLVLGEFHRGWNAYWGNERVEQETLRKLFVNEGSIKILEIVKDYDQWKIDAVIQETERIMGLI